jgi:hypothetical protein
LLDEKTLYSLVEKAKKYDDLIILNDKKGPFLHCSFCGKDQSSIEQLIAGPEAYICDECIGLCVEIINEKANDIRKGELPNE